MHKQIIKKKKIKERERDRQTERARETERDYIKYRLPCQTN